MKVFLFRLYNKIRGKMNGYTGVHVDKRPDGFYEVWIEYEVKRKANFVVVSRDELYSMFFDVALYLDEVSWPKDMKFRLDDATVVEIPTYAMEDFINAAHPFINRIIDEMIRNGEFITLEELMRRLWSDDECTSK